MRRILVIILFLTVANGISIAQNQLQDIVYLKNGSIIKGVIVEQWPGQSLKIKTSDGRIYVYQMDEVERMVREEQNVEKGEVQTVKKESIKNEPVVEKEKASVKDFKQWQLGVNIGPCMPLGDFKNVSFASTGLSLGLDFGVWFNPNIGLMVSYFGNGFPLNIEESQIGLGEMFGVNSYNVHVAEATIGIGGFMGGIGVASGGDVRFTGRLLVGAVSLTYPELDYYINSPDQWILQDEINESSLGLDLGIGLSIKMSELLSLDFHCDYKASHFDIKNARVTIAGMGTQYGEGEVTYSSLDLVASLKFHF